VAEPPVLALRDAAVTFGGPPLFAQVELALTPGLRACLVGRNGSGKSTLLRVLGGALELDKGERFAQPGLRIGVLPQDPVLPPDQAVADFVGDGYEAAAAIDRLRLDGDRKLGALSGGEGRRAALARALTGQPDVLLLDEPTNHLDLPTILWLEQTLRAYRGALLVISHDRAFLGHMTRHSFWLDRGTLRAHGQGFAAFDAWQAEVYADEEAAARRLDQHLKAETRWLLRGITARRRRNQGRLTKLKAMRETRRTLLTGPGTAKLTAAAGDASGKLVIEAQEVAKGYDGTTVIPPFSTRILRGDRIGIVGRNGAGKTTLVDLLTGRLAPDAGRVRIGANVTPAVFDQRRAQLDPEATLWQVLAPGGGDSLIVRGRSRHVVAYLRDFLFDERQAKAPVKTLSGGEKNRLLLAKLLARPANLLVLDEPTNDLDMDTLDLLEDVLGDYDGTLLLVSHDRDFLDRLVTSTIVLDGTSVAEYPGGVGDALRQGARFEAETGTARPKRRAAAARPSTAAKLTYTETRELDQLPTRIDELGEARDRLGAALSEAGFFDRDPDAFAATARKLEEVEAALAAAEDRWLALEGRREDLARQG